MKGVDLTKHTPPLPFIDIHTKSNGLRPINSWPLKNLKGLGLFPNEILKNQEVGVLKISPIQAAP